MKNRSQNARTAERIVHKRRAKQTRPSTSDKKALASVPNDEAKRMGVVDLVFEVCSWSTNPLRLLPAGWPAHNRMIQDSP